MAKQHVVLWIGIILFISSAIGEYPKLKSDFNGYLFDLGLVIGVTFLLLLVMYIWSK